MWYDHCWPIKYSAPRSKLQCYIRVPQWCNFNWFSLFTLFPRDNKLWIVFYLNSKKWKISTRFASLKYNDLVLWGEEQRRLDVLLVNRIFLYSAIFHESVFVTCLGQILEIQDTSKNCDRCPTFTFAAWETILIRQFRRPSSHKCEPSNYTLFKMQKRLILFFLSIKRKELREISVKSIALYRKNKKITWLVKKVHSQEVCTTNREFQLLKVWIKCQNINKDSNHAGEIMRAAWLNSCRQYIE